VRYRRRRARQLKPLSEHLSFRILTCMAVQTEDLENRQLERLSTKSMRQRSCTMTAQAYSNRVCLYLIRDRSELLSYIDVGYMIPPSF